MKYFEIQSRRLKARDRNKIQKVSSGLSSRQSPFYLERINGKYHVKKRALGWQNIRL